MSDSPAGATAAQPGSTAVEDPTTAEIRRQVENEQVLADSQKRIKELEGELETAKREAKELQDAKLGAAAEGYQLRTQLAALQSTHHKSTSELGVLQTRNDAIEREKRELLEETERLQQRSNRVTQELFTLRSQRQDSSQKLAHLDVEVSELRMAAESSKFNEQRSTQALQTARNEILQLSKSNADVDERFGRYRAEKQAELSQLQLEHDAAVARVTSTDNSYHALQRTYNDQSRRLAEAHANIATLTAAAASRKASTSSEFARLMEENRVLEKRAEEARVTIAEREAELERMVDSSGETTKVWEDKWKKEERLRREAEKRAEDLQIVVERLAMAGGDGSDISPAVALATGMKAGGKTYTQFYTDYTILEGKLRTSENEVIRMTQLLDEISADISEKKPLLDEQAAEHARAIERANALAAELSNVMSTRDARDVEVRSLNATAALQKDEVAALQSTTEDLSRQVQSLLRQIALKDDPSLSSLAMEGTATVDDSGDLITDHFVEFRSIRSLQSQNQKLLRLTRGLIAKLDAQEIDRAGADVDDLNTGATLDQATETIQKLHAQLLEAQKKINEATRERDFFSKLLARGDGLKWSVSGNPLENGTAPHEQALTSLQAEIDTIRLRAEKEVGDVKEELRKQSDAAGQAEVGRARAEAQVTLLQEQHRMMNDVTALQKQELSNIEGQLRQLQGSISIANNERRSALEEVASRQAEADRLRNDVANVRAEKEQLASTESRLQSDFRSVQSERAKLQQLIDNLQNVNVEHEKTRAEEKARLEKRVEEVQREMTALRGQLDAARDATRAAEKRADDIQPQIEAATAAIRAEKEAAEAQVQARTEEITKLNTQIEQITAESQNRLRIGINHQRRNKDLMAEKEENAQTLAANTAEIDRLNASITSTTKEMDETKSKVTELEKQLADAERGSGLKDATVSRLQSELAQVRSGASASAGDAATIAAIKSERDSLQEKLAQVEKDLAEAKTAAAPSTSGDAAPASEALQARIDELEKDKEAIDQKYEENVSKVNRVNQVLRQRVSTTDEIRVSLENRIAELEKQLNDLQSSSTSLPEGSTADQAVIDAAVKSAVSARESELRAEHARALQEARSTDVKMEPSDGSVETQRAELESSFAKRVDDAVAEKKAEMDKEIAELKGQIETLQQKIKVLERNVKTAEISRKTLEAKLKKYEAEATTPAAAAPATPGLSADAAAIKPGESSSPAAGSTTTDAKASPGSIRGRGRAVRGTGRGAKASAVLNAVNATLAQSTASQTPTSPSSSGTKRPAPEEGEIAEGSSTDGASSILSRIGPAGDASGAPATGTRQLKRPRGLGSARGAALTRAGRKASADTSPQAQQNEEQAINTGGETSAPATEGETKADSGGHGDGDGGGGAAS